MDNRKDKMERMLLMLAVALLTAVSLASCLDETLVSTTHAVEETDEDADMYLNISVPRTDASTGAVATDKELAVRTLDVLVFREGKEADAGKFFVYAACKGKLTDAERTFKVVMPVGDNLIVHVFVNCRRNTVAWDFYKSRGKEMNAMLAGLTLDADPNTAATDSLPMHGYLTNMTIDKDQVGKTFTVPVLRSVAAVQVMTKATESTGADGKLILTPGIVTDAGGNPNFALRELYVYHYSNTGRIAADAASYQPLVPGETDKTRNVAKVTLPVGHSVADTQMQGASGTPRPYSIISADAQDKLGCLYLYENPPHASSGPGLDFTEKTATRLVIGGVYGTDKNTNGTPKVTYYRADFADADNNLLSVLRNHKYTVSIEKVTSSGYATPDEAALGASANVYIKLFSWADELTNSDFNSENYFNSETKSIVLPRTQNSSQQISVDSDVEAGKWEMSFATAANGAAAVSGNTISNHRYKVEKAADGKSLTFTVLKAYNPLTGTESRNETFIIKANRLEVTYKITQTNTSPDDWADGGGQNWEEGEKVIDLGSAFSFYFAPGNLRAVKNADGTLTHSFAPQQQIISGDPLRGGYCFDKNKLNPFWGEIADGGDGDPCSKVGKGWYTPNSGQLRQMMNTGRWGGTMEGVSGYYYGRTTVPTLADDPYSYVFLPTGRIRLANGNTYGYTLYGISDGASSAGLFTNWGNGNLITGGSSTGGVACTGRYLRCVINKN